MRKSIIGVASAFLIFAGAVPAHANVVIDPVVGPGVTGGCFSEFAGQGSSMNIIVEAAVVAPGALSVSVTCHVTQQTWWGQRDNHVGAAGVASAAAGGGVITGYDLAPYEVCAEVHASFLTGPPYNKECHH